MPEGRFTEFFTDKRVSQKDSSGRHPLRFPRFHVHRLQLSPFALQRDVSFANIFLCILVEIVRARRESHSLIGPPFSICLFPPLPSPSHSSPRCVIGKAEGFAGASAGAFSACSISSLQPRSLFANWKNDGADSRGNVSSDG